MKKIQTIDELNAILETIDATHLKKLQIKTIRWLIKNRELTMTEFANQAGVHYQTVIKILMEERSGTKNTWNKFIQALDIQPAEVALLSRKKILTSMEADIQSYGEQTMIYLYTMTMNGFICFVDYDIDHHDSSYEHYIRINIIEGYELIRRQDPLEIEFQNV